MDIERLLTTTTTTTTLDYLTVMSQEYFKGAKTAILHGLFLMSSLLVNLQCEVKLTHIVSVRHAGGNHELNT